MISEASLPSQVPECGPSNKLLLDKVNSRNSCYPHLRAILRLEVQRHLTSNPKSYNDNQRNSFCLHRQGVGPLAGGMKTRPGYFRPPVLAEARAAFGKTQDFHSTMASQRCPRMGQGPGQSELPVSCLTVWH